MSLGLKLSRSQGLLLVSGLAAALLYGWMIIGYAVPFGLLLPNMTIPDFIATGYDRSYIDLLRGDLDQNEIAAGILQDMHLFPDLLFPPVLALFLSGLILQLAPGVTLFGRLITQSRAKALCLLTLGYLICDWVENTMSLKLFAITVPTQFWIDTLSDLLPWATSLKFMFLIVTAIIIIRMVLFHLFQSPKDQQS